MKQALAGLRSEKCVLARFRSRLWAAAALALALGGCSSPSATRLAYVVGSQNAIAGFRFNSKSGAGQELVGSPFLSGNAPSSIVITPSNRFVYVANQDDNTISRFRIDPSSGALTEILPRTPTGLSPGVLAMDTGGSFLFVANQISSDVWVFSIGASGALSQVSSVPLGASPAGLTLLSEKNLLYVPLPNFSAIAGFSVSAGRLVPVAASPTNPFPVSGGVATVAADPGGSFLYVPNPSANTVTVLAIRADGTLSSGPGAFTTGTVPVAAATDPSGAYLYVANSVAATVSEYRIDSTSGSLTPLSPATVTSGTNPRFFLLDPDGAFLFVGNQGSASVGEFTVHSNGALATTGNSLQPGVPPRSLALTK